MKIFIEKDNKQLVLKAKTVTDLLNKLEINPDTVLVVKNNEVVLSDEILSETDEIKILSVISGG